MTTQSLQVVILAAGQGKRMHSHLPKVLHRLAGRPMLLHVLDSARRLAPTRLAVVIGHGGEAVASRLEAPDLPSAPYAGPPGREAEVGLLLEGLYGAVRRQRTALLLSGEAGIGKTRLCDETSRLARY